MISAPSSQGSVNSEFKPFKEEFKRIAILFKNQKAAHRADQINIRFGETEPSEAAVCYYLINEIVINKEFFHKIPIESKEELIFHELGHCVMNKNHTKTGIMKAAGMHKPKFYRENYKKLINDLFGCKTLDCVNIKFNPNKYKKGKTMSKKDEIMNNSHAVVRFTADWCGPCRNMKPIFEEVALANPTVKVYTIDIDKDSETAQEFGIKAIPTLVKIVDNAEDTRTVGGQTKDKIEELFKK